MNTYDYDLGQHSFTVSTTSPDAQLWFDRGLLWCYGYNHDESVACYKRALEFDPDCAMAAGAISPTAGFKYALQNGADFICAGMFDFQVKDDSQIMRGLFARGIKRDREWMA